MLTLDSGACNTIPFSALGDPRAVREGSKRYVRLPSGKVARVISLNGIWVAEMGMLEYTTQSLPPVTGLPEGTEVFVGDYNGNIARLINGVWRYISPFIVAWASRPAANAVPIGTELQVTDFANQKWVSDGAYWRPAQGRALLLSKSSGASGFIAQISGLTAAVFAVSGNEIPASMIPPQGRLLVASDGFKTGAAAGYRLRTHLGLLNNAGDPEITSVVGGSATGSSFAMSTSARFGQETGRFSSRGGLGEGVSSTAGFTMNSKNTGLNTQEDMFVNIAVAEGNIADVYNLVSLQVWLEA